MHQSGANNMKPHDVAHVEQAGADREMEVKPGSINMAEAAKALNNQKPTRTMFLFAVWIASAAWVVNFDLGYQGAVLIMPSYNMAFGHCQQVPKTATGATTEQCSLSALQQSLVGLQTLFYAVGAATAGPVGTWLGRRRTIQVACALCIISAAGMLGTAGSFLNYMVCKCIGGVGIGQLQAVAIVYGSECTAANKRGLLLGLYNAGLALGNVSAAAVTAGTAKLPATQDWQWKTPILCQIPLNLMLALGTMYFHESPRWFMIKGKEEQARTAFAAYLQAEPYSDIVTAQVVDVERHIGLERSIVATASWTEIYGARNFRRTLTSMFILTGMAVSGIQFVGYYAALFLAGVGIENPYLINVILGLCIFASALPGPLAPEYLGRQLSMLVGYGAMAVFMVIFASVSTGLGPTNPIAKNIVVVFLCLWAFVFGSLIGPCVWLASAEVHSVRLRTYGQASTTVVYNIFAFAATFWTPYMLNPNYGNMGANVGYFYFGITFIWLVLVFLLVPETARLTLEQIDGLFEPGRRAWKTSLSKNKQLSGIRMEEVRA